MGAPMEGAIEARPLFGEERRDTLSGGAYEQRRGAPGVELRREKVEDLIGAHAVEVVVEIELLDDGDEAPQVAGAIRRSAAFRSLAPVVPVEKVDGLDQAAVGDEIAAEAEVVDEGAVLMDSRMEEQPRVLPVHGEQL